MKVGRCQDSVITTPAAHHIHPHIANAKPRQAIRAPSLTPAVLNTTSTSTNTTLTKLATGAANIGDAGLKKQAVRADRDLVPEAAVRASKEDTDYHTGRGGAGNEHIAKKPSQDKAGGAPVGLADKLKRKFLGVFKK